MTEHQKPSLEWIKEHRDELSARFEQAEWFKGQPTAKHNEARCECGRGWTGPQAAMAALSHQQGPGHSVTISARVTCRDGCCDV